MIALMKASASWVTAVLAVALTSHQADLHRGPGVLALLVHAGVSLPACGPLNQHGARRLLRYSPRLALSPCHGHPDPDPRAQ